MTKYLALTNTLKRRDGAEFKRDTVCVVLRENGNGTVNLCEAVPFPEIGRTIATVALKHTRPLLVLEQNHVELNHLQ